MLKFTGNGADYSETFSLYIGGLEEVSWSGLTTNSFKQGEAKEVQLLVTNSGTLPFNHMVSATSSKDWDIEVVGDGIVDLALGESKTIKLIITPNGDGFANITLSFNSAENPEATAYTFNANAEKQSSESAAFGLPITQIGLAILVTVILVGIGLVLLRPNRPKPTMPVMPLPMPIAQRQQLVPPQPLTPAPQVIMPIPATTPQPQKQTAICWQCRKPIAGKVVGCPKCGARYCGDESDTCKLSQLESCLSCQSPTSDFISE